MMRRRALRSRRQPRRNSPPGIITIIESRKTIGSRIQMRPSVAPDGTPGPVDRGGPFGLPMPMPAGAHESTSQRYLAPRLYRVSSMLNASYGVLAFAFGNTPMIRPTRDAYEYVTESLVN